MDGQGSREEGEEGTENVSVVIFIVAGSALSTFTLGVEARFGRQH